MCSVEQASSRSLSVQTDYTHPPTRPQPRDGTPHRIGSLPHSLYLISLFFSHSHSSSFNSSNITLPFSLYRISLVLYHSLTSPLLTLPDSLFHLCSFLPLTLFLMSPLPISLSSSLTLPPISLSLPHYAGFHSSSLSPLSLPLLILPDSLFYFS